MLVIIAVTGKLCEALIPDFIAGPTLPLSGFRDSRVVSISACHADDPGSIPGRGVLHPPACRVASDGSTKNQACHFAYIMLRCSLVELG